MEDILNYLQLGTTGAIFAWFIYWFFKDKSQKKDPLNGTGKAILAELEKQNTNHLEHLQGCTEKGFEKLADKLEKTNELLYKVLGVLEAKK